MGKRGIHHSLYCVFPVIFDETTQENVLSENFVQ